MLFRSPTKGNLILAKNSLKLSRQGYELMDKKRNILIREMMKVALQFMNVNSSYTYIVQGLVIIVAVAIDIRKYLAKK